MIRRKNRIVKEMAATEIQTWAAASVSLPGGLAFVPATDRYWTIAERNGRSVLGWFDETNFDASMLHDSGLFLAAGFWRGLTYDESRDCFYALHASGFGAYELREIDPNAGTVKSLFRGPRAAFGGMTSVGPGMLTALLATDPEEGFRLHRIDLEARKMTPFGQPLGLLMNGGLRWDRETDSQYVAAGSTEGGDWMVYAIAADGSTVESICLFEESSMIELPELAMAASRS